VGELERWARAPPQAAWVLARRWWPGPLTLVLRRATWVPLELTGGLDTVALRLPAHPLARRLIAEVGVALAAPSANRFGRVSPTLPEHVEAELPEVSVLDGGPAELGLESTIVDLTGERPALLRPGAISRAALVEDLGPLGHSATRAPGGLDRHYAPRTALRLSPDPEAEVVRLRESGLRVERIQAHNAEDLAPRLYAELRRLDGLGLDVLVAPILPMGGLGEAVNDRLQRAALGSGALPA
jgi:L-threonylcarbamoyladenylate synthase